LLDPVDPAEVFGEGSGGGPPTLGDIFPEEFKATTADRATPSFWSTN